MKLFKHRVLAWDVWNEPNGAGFYLDPPGHNMWTVGEIFRTCPIPAPALFAGSIPTATIVLGSVAENGVTDTDAGRRHAARGALAHRHAGAVGIGIPDFFPGLFAYFNAHPEYKPYACSTMIGLHPYYWTRFRSEGGGIAS